MAEVIHKKTFNGNFTISHYLAFQVDEIIRVTIQMIIIFYIFDYSSSINFKILWPKKYVTCLYAGF